MLRHKNWNDRHRSLAKQMSSLYSEQEDSFFQSRQTTRNNSLIICQCHLSTSQWFFFKLAHLLCMTRWIYEIIISYMAGFLRVYSFLCLLKLAHSSDFIKQNFYIKILLYSVSNWNQHLHSASISLFALQLMLHRSKNKSARHRYDCPTKFTQTI